ncbi:MAG: FMN-binding protein, partial [Clostridiales bacterium]|nr:FMN-binding protein [Clostridiales bacterium]
MRRKALDYLVLLAVTLVAGIALAGVNRLSGGGADAGRTATASAKGYAGPVAVTVTVDDNGAIAAIVVGDDQFAETEGLGAKAKDPAFAAQFVGKTYPVALGEGIDAIS